MISYTEIKRPRIYLERIEEIEMLSSRVIKSRRDLSFIAELTEGEYKRCRSVMMLKRTMCDSVFFQRKKERKTEIENNTKRCG